MITHGRAGTYSSGCRCTDCRQAWTEFHQRSYKSRAYHRACTASARWVRDNRPDVWAELLEAELERVKRER